MNFEHFSWRISAVAATCLGLCACDPSLIVSGQPDTHLARTLSGADREAEVAGACGIPSGSLVAAGEPSVQDCYWIGKSAIDYKYQAYKTNLLHAVNNGSALGDFTVLALNTAGTITPGATAAKLFNALAAGVTGTKTLINQDILYKQTVTILIGEMDSDRGVEAKAAMVDLKAGATRPQMVNDLLAYYEAGTFQHALVAIQNKAGVPSVADNVRTDGKLPSAVPPAAPAAPAPAPKG